MSEYFRKITGLDVHVGQLLGISEEQVREYGGGLTQFYDTFNNSRLVKKLRERDELALNVLRSCLEHMNVPAGKIDEVVREPAGKNDITLADTLALVATLEIIAHKQFEEQAFTNQREYAQAV